MKMRFKDRVVVITGASSGIGRALSLKFGEEGAKVVVSARSEEKLKTVAEDIKNRGGNAIYVRADVCVRDDVKKIFQETIKNFSRVDILVNNAGIGFYGEVEKLDNESLMKLFETNVFGPLYCIQEAIPIMKKQGSGHIVNVSSVAGRRAMPGVAGYAMTKFALHALSESLRIELLPYNIHVTVISPGLIKTDFPDHAMRGPGTPAVFSKESRKMTAEECAEIILGAVYKRKREEVITVGGKFIVFMNKFFPSFTDWLVSKVAPRLREKQ
jgi:short-subunit dehydrogenase